jgi:3-deoxy-manno-octulosonate cytidylyltransferase (CMP-KDO synthetase)
MIHGKSMIMRVCDQAMKATCLSEVVVATDDARILEHVQAHGGKAMMTSADHPSGTDRVNEAAAVLIGKAGKAEENVVINIQGDEPFIDPAAIDTLASCFRNPEIRIATLIKKITSQEELFDNNVVKVIPGSNRQALYFSRAALPFVRGKVPSDWIALHPFFKHIGIYAYRADILGVIAGLEPSTLEKTEGLEQLRWLEHGYNIHTEETDYESISVDSPEDLSKFTNKA